MVGPYPAKVDGERRELLAEALARKVDHHLHEHRHGLGVPEQRLGLVVNGQVVTSGRKGGGKWEERVRRMDDEEGTSAHTARSKSEQQW